MEKRLATEGYDSFDAMNLKENLLKGIYEYGYKKPSVIQQRVIVPFSKGDDLVVQEMLGPGITSTYCIGVLQQLNLRIPECQCLILALGSLQIMEIAAAMRKLGRFMNVKVNARLRTVDDDDLLTDPSHVVVGGTAHVHELVRRKKLCLKEIKMLVLDEADMLIDIDFRWVQVYEIINYLNKHTNRVQIGAFSETMSTLTRDRITEQMKKSVVILAQNGHELSLDGIRKHEVLNLEKEVINFKNLEKVEKLKEIIDEKSKIAPLMVLVSTTALLNFLTNKLEDDNYIFSVVQGCMDQKKRDEIKEEFLQQKHVILATSIWARGIIEECGDEVRFIVNYDNSPCVEQYIWELGWFRKVDAAISFATSDDWFNLIWLQKDYNIGFERFQPSGREETVKVSTIKKTPIKHFIIDCGDDEGIINVLRHNGQGSLYDKFYIARLSVIFAKDLRQISWLATELKIDSKYEVLTPKDSLKVHSTLPTILITTDDMFDDRKVKVHLVVNVDVRSAHQNYDRRRHCCQSNGIFLLLATDVDWYVVFDMQALYNVSFTPIPQDIDDILKKMAGTEISPSTSKGHRTRSQTRKRPRTRSQTQRLLIN